jgi:diguanylate cyclase (GGDEF)-like protein
VRRRLQAGSLRKRSLTDTRYLVQALKPAWIPAGILVVTALLAWLVPLPASLAGLGTAGPYALLSIGLGMAWRFNRGRAFVMLASLLGGFAACHIFPVKEVCAAVAVLVPLNVLAAMLFPERGARYRASYGWLLLLIGEGIGILWASTAAPGLFDNFLLRSPPAPLAARVVLAAAFAAAVWRAWPELTPLQVGIAGALAAFYIAAEWAASPGVYGAFMAAAGAILVISLLEESHRLAFRDPLTGLPGRRALEERLRSLGSRYAIAMVDVDHFKQFNDTHGHDIGDQMLKLVGARLAEVGGGGVAYRYGGEEFSVLFPDAALREVMPHLEAIRRSIASYRLAVRALDRPKSLEQGAKLRGNGSPEQHLSVTISIGASSPTGRLRTPAQVIRAADEALYRAKQAGRNQVRN